MAVQLITSKRIVKHDTKSPNFKPEPVVVKPEPIVNGNSAKNNTNGVYQGDIKPATNVYGEEMKDMMSTMMGKLDNIKVQNGNININDASVEVDIKRNVFLSKADDANVKIDNVKKGKVNNKVNKLRALRNK